MRKLAFAVLVGAGLFALSQCELFYATVEYRIEGSSTSLDFRYLDGEGHLTESSGAAAPLSVSFQLFNSQLPFLAFIEVTNNDFANEVTADILEDGDIVRGTSVAAADGPAALYWIVD
jgi:hypothetical protein